MGDWESEVQNEDGDGGYNDRQQCQKLYLH